MYRSFSILERHSPHVINEFENKLLGKTFK